MSFEPDDRIAADAERDSLGAVAFAKKVFSIDLDWSDESIKSLEDILARIHKDLPRVKPTEAKMLGLARLLGSYVGEVFRRNHGATWGVVTLNGDTYPGLLTAVSKTNFWPWDKVFKRIMNGPENSIWWYYQVLLSKTPTSEGGPNAAGI